LPPSAAGLPAEVKVSCGLALFVGRLGTTFTQLVQGFGALLSHLECTRLFFKTTA
jgi:hypothetical protein